QPHHAVSDDPFDSEDGVEDGKTLSFEIDYRALNLLWLHLRHRPHRCCPLRQIKLPGEPGLARLAWRQTPQRLCIRGAGSAWTYCDNLGGARRAPAPPFIPSAARGTLRCAGNEYRGRSCRSHRGIRRLHRSDPCIVGKLLAQRRHDAPADVRGFAKMIDETL